MKTRNGFVSNSSSSSFMILTNKPVDIIESSIKKIILDLDTSILEDYEREKLTNDINFNEKIINDFFKTSFINIKKFNRSELYRFLQNTIVGYEICYNKRRDRVNEFLTEEIIKRINDYSEQRKIFDKIKNPTLNDRKKLSKVEDLLYKEEDKHADFLCDKFIKEYKYIQIQEYYDNEGTWGSIMEHSVMPEIFHRMRDNIQDTKIIINNNH